MNKSNSELNMKSLYHYNKNTVYYYLQWKQLCICTVYQLWSAAAESHFQSLCCPLSCRSCGQCVFSADSYIRGETLDECDKTSCSKETLHVDSCLLSPWLGRGKLMASLSTGLHCCSPHRSLVFFCNTRSKMTWKFQEYITSHLFKFRVQFFWMNE